MARDLSKIAEVTGRYRPVSLEEMDQVKLMNRMDTKYILNVDQLPDLLEQAMDQYRILTIDSNRIFGYNSLYFDTPGLRSYFDHHNGIRPRYKVRFREYENTGGIYLEVKRKINNDRTRKSRIRVEKIEQELSDESLEYIRKRSPLPASELQPSLWTIFRRITLVGKEFPERLTIDMDLSFRHLDHKKALPFMAVCEVKRDQSNGLTEFMRILKNARIYPTASSKYCLGTILLKSPVKHNRFKYQLHILKKIENVQLTYSDAG
jgi:hypothetical protein